MNPNCGMMKKHVEQKPLMTMTPEQARIILLEAELIHAHACVRFLHECLTEPEHCHYAYPEHTLDDLKRWKELVPDISKSGCYHSRIDPDCECCQRTHQKFLKIKEAREVLENEKSFFGYCEK